METNEAKGLSKSYDSLSNVKGINFAIEVKNLNRIFTKAKEKPFIAHCLKNHGRAKDYKFALFKGYYT
jgi:hypothetical protein